MAHIPTYDTAEAVLSDWGYYRDNPDYMPIHIWPKKLAEDGQEAALDWLDDELDSLQESNDMVRDMHEEVYGDKHDAVADVFDNLDDVISRLNDAVAKEDIDLIPDLLEEARQAAGNVQEYAPTEDDINGMYDEEDSDFNIEDDEDENEFDPSEWGN